MTSSAVRSLAACIAGHVDDGVRTRGQRYFHAGHVTSLHGDDQCVGATVQGTRPYDISIVYEPSAHELAVDCTCPYFVDRGEPCKHIWATVLAADERSLLGRATSGSYPVVVPEEGVDDWDEVDDESWPEGLNKPGAWSDAVGRVIESKPDRRPSRSKGRKPKPPPSWTEQIGHVRRQLEAKSAEHEPAWPADRRLFYIIDSRATLTQGSLVLDIACRQRKKDGRWGKLTTRQIARTAVGGLPDDDQLILALLVGADAGFERSYYRYASSFDKLPSDFLPPPPLLPTLMPLLCRTGRCLLHDGDDETEPAPIRWDGGEPWKLCLEITETPTRYALSGALRRGEQHMGLDQPSFLTAGGILIADGCAARFDDAGAFEWVPLLRTQPTINVPAAQGTQLLGTILCMPRLPALTLPASLRYEEITVEPRPRVIVKRPRGRWGWGSKLPAKLSFDYDGTVVAPDDPARGVFRADDRQFLLRDAAAEAAAAAQLREIGFKDPPAYCDAAAGELSVTPKQLPKAALSLTEAGWHVDAEGYRYRTAGSFRAEVTSGVDWFELHGTMEFGDQAAPLPELLRAVKEGSRLVRLDDGTVGILPEQWLQRYARIAELGTADQDHVRFERTQVGLLDALLEALPEARIDRRFDKARRELRRFDGVRPVKAPRTFKGALRPYQCDGLGWFGFLRRFGFGGCLADDMGLGKTVQVLALLESRRTLPPKDRPPPSLVVVPRSLVFNWMAEAAHFTPRLRVFAHTGIQRTKSAEHLADHDVILTTYGTLRRDIVFLTDARFDYVVLDESQAIKNPTTQSAKAVRLLQADHRLALSGTPIENHLGELWSLFDFLNPGMLGGSGAWARRVAGQGGRNLDDETLRLLAQGLRPFILRRTKEQVAADLPEKIEQTIHCDLLAKDRRRYDELRRHYRRSLLQRVDRDGIGRAKIHVLEALLRLRQAACHPGLVDKSKVAESSAKLELLVPKLREVTQEGHKALVFSQFTSLLAIVRDQLDGTGISYEYLDGRTRKRADHVQRFQTDPECRLFLISLKAGGLGLNLTAADYVFLLDPWWNPAVEAQAVDRTHRIGQTRRVFAHRLIARDTVEEKVLQLQQSKRRLADAIITADNSLIRDLTREDLDLLLS